MTIDWNEAIVEYHQVQPKPDYHIKSLTEELRPSQAIRRSFSVDYIHLTKPPRIRVMNAPTACWDLETIDTSSTNGKED